MVDNKNVDYAKDDNIVKEKELKKEKDYLSTSLIILSIFVFGLIILFSIFRFM